MNFFDMLLNAKNETEFFVILSGLLNPQPLPKIRPEVTSVVENGVLGLRLSLEQTLTYLRPNGKDTYFKSEVTHVFTLNQNGQLTWWMKDQPTQVGLDNIKAALQKLKDSLLSQQLPSQV